MRPRQQANAAGMPAAFAGRTRCGLVEQQCAVGFLFAHLAVEELVVVEINFDKRRTGFDAAWISASDSGSSTYFCSARRSGRAP